MVVKPLNKYKNLSSPQVERRSRVTQAGIRHGMSNRASDLSLENIILSMTLMRHAGVSPDPGTALRYASLVLDDSEGIRSKTNG